MKNFERSRLCWVATPVGAVVEMADAQVLAAQRDHWSRTESKALRADDGRLDHVEAGLQPTVGLQPYPLAQIVSDAASGVSRQVELPGRAAYLIEDSGLAPVPPS